MESLKQTTEVQLVPFNKSFLETIWKIGFSTEKPEWTKLNAPYFNDYRKFEDAKSFIASPIADVLSLTVSLSGWFQNHGRMKQHDG